MRKSLAIGAAIAAVALSFGLAACGSSDDSGDSSTEDTLTKTELISQADAICKKASDELDQAFTAASADGTVQGPELVKFVTDTVLPSYEKQAADLRELQPSPSEEDAWNNLLTELNDAIASTRQDPQAALSGDNPFEDAKASAKELGLKECGTGS